MISGIIFVSYQLHNKTVERGETCEQKFLESQKVVNGRGTKGNPVYLLEFVFFSSFPIL